MVENNNEIIATMQTMRSDRKTLKLLGIISTDDESYYWKISHIVCYATPVVFLWPVILYFFAHITDVSEATSAFYMICVIGMATSIYSEFWFKQHTILSMLQQIQMLVDYASKDCRPIYEKAELLAYNIVHSLKLIAFWSVYGVVSLQSVY